MPMTPEEQTAFDAMKSENEKNKKELDELKNKPAPKGKDKEGDEEDENDDEEDLSDKANKKKKKDDESKASSAKLETALTFNVGLKNWMIEQKDFLPEEITTIVNLAEKEIYDSAIQKANDIKASIIKEFFLVQANLDLLTEPHKKKLDLFNKMSKAGRQEKAEDVWENVFEPTFETLKKVTKAGQLNRSPGSYNSRNPIDESYKQKLMKGSKAAYLGEKGDTK